MRRSPRGRGPMWRYHELLPIDGEPTVGQHVGGTPLIRADRLARALGVSELYLKNDAVNHPTLSFKDRVVAVALSKAVELGFQTVGCASTGQPGGQRRGQRRGRGPGGLRPHPRRPGTGQGSGGDHLRRQGHRHAGQLRPRQSPLLADRLPLSAGASSTSTSGPSTPRVRNRWDSRSPRTWAGEPPITSSRRWPAAA